MPTTSHFVCKTCDVEFNSPAGLGQHVGLTHRECAVCGDTFEDGDSLDEHTRAQH